MKLKTHIRQQVSQYLDTLIPENQWEYYIDLLDREGKFSRKNLMGIVLLLCAQVEQLEKLIEGLYNETGTTEIRLRTPRDIEEELDKLQTPATKAFYLSASDFKVYEKKVEGTLSKTDPHFGYSREVDPKDGKEKTCLLYKDLPVFRE